MPRTSKGPRYYHKGKRRGWYAWYKGRLHTLAAGTGEPHDSYDQARAYLAWWELTGTSLIERLRQVDWRRLYQAQHENGNLRFQAKYPQATRLDPDEVFFLLLTGDGTLPEDQVRDNLTQAGISDLCLASHVKQKAK